MITKLPEWYRIADFATTNVDALESRSQVINTIIETKKTEWLLDCIRLYLNKPIINQEFKIDFNKLFLDNDPLFHQRNNELELRVLAGAIISEYINCAENEDCITLGLALITGSFKITEIINSDILDDAIEYINNKSVELREHSIELELAQNGEEDDLDDDDIKVTPEALKIKFDNIYKISEINKFLNAIHNKVKKLEEESNIHWWIFRGFSNYKCMLMSDLDIKIAPIILGMELSDLISIIPGPIAAKQFLKKVLIDTSSDHIDSQILKDVINNLEIKDKEKLVLKYQKTNLGNICPLMFGYSKAIEAGDDESWISFFERSTGVKSKTKVEAYDLAYQFYLENLLVKRLA